MQWKAQMNYKGYSTSNLLFPFFFFFLFLLFPYLLACDWRKTKRPNWKGRKIFCENKTRCFDKRKLMEWGSMRWNQIQFCAISSNLKRALQEPILWENNSVCVLAVSWVVSLKCVLCISKNNRKNRKPKKIVPQEYIRYIWTRSSYRGRCWCRCLVF